MTWLPAATQEPFPSYVLCFIDVDILERVQKLSCGNDLENRNDNTAVRNISISIYLVDPRAYRVSRVTDPGNRPFISAPEEVMLQPSSWKLKLENSD